MDTTQKLLSPETLNVEIKNAQKLLNESIEESLPENVKRVITFLTKKNIGFILSRNQSAGNCRDARSKRNRIGHIGIPLFDELKSLIGFVIDKAGKEIIIAMHCRGHRNIDLESVTKILSLKTPIKPLPEEKLMKYFNIEFGTVNPILLELNLHKEVLQIFDRGILSPIARFSWHNDDKCGKSYMGIRI